MSAAELRKAAETLRGRVRLVPQDPDEWTPDSIEMWACDGSWIVEHDRRMSAYIATMHPGVGLALADWLEEHADDHTESRHQCRWVTCSGETLARLILGGAA